MSFQEIFKKNVLANSVEVTIIISLKCPSLYFLFAVMLLESRLETLECARVYFPAMLQ